MKLAPCARISLFGHALQFFLQGTSGGHSHFQLCGGVAVGLVQFDPSTLGSAGKIVVDIAED